MIALLLRSPRASVDVSLIALVVAAAALSVVRVQPLSGLVMLLAMCVVPGAAFLTRVATTEPVVTVAVAVGLSLALDTALATVLAWTGWWYPEVAAAAVAAGAVTLLLVDLRRSLDEARGRSS
jgi:hypothetical protein